MAEIIIKMSMLTLTALAIPYGRSQVPERAEFEVISIKPNRGRPLIPACNGDRFLQGMPVGIVIQWAFGLSPARIQGLPDWTADRDFAYLIEAKASKPISSGECKAMVQSLLVNRFKMVSHQEVRDLPAFALTVSKSGPKLHEIKPGDKGAATAQGQIYLSNSGPQPTGVSMSRLAAYLSTIPAIGSPVVDRTELQGIYSFNLDFSIADSDDRPPIWTALQEQLGLKLERTKAPIEVLVVDRIEKPETN